MDQSALLEKVRKSRESKLTVGAWTFTIKRPTDSEFVEHQQLRSYELARLYVIDWAGVTEADMVKGGASDDVQFSRDLWIEFVNDHPELWDQIFDEILNAYRGHMENRLAAKKN